MGDDIPFRDDDLDPPLPVGNFWSPTPTDWTTTSPSDPIADMREAALRIWYDRPLTDFERIMARNGLASLERHDGTPRHKPEP